MKKHLLSLATIIFVATQSTAQLLIDTLAIQDFETVPAAPTWTYTGTLADLQTGNAPAGSCIPNTPLGINSSTAWHVASVSGGNAIVFDNQTIPANYDSVFVSFHLQGLNLNSSAGGPDHLDYVLVEYSLDGGLTYTSRVRVRGAVNNNSFWSYDAAGQAVVDYLPATEALFQPTNSGLQMTEGISFVKIGFPGSISQLAVRITPRSSSSSDSWLIDNVLLTGKENCVNTGSSIVETSCGVYTAPSGSTHTTSGLFYDIIPNAAGCDSVITIDLTVLEPTSSTITADACDSYLSPAGNVYSSTGTYYDTITNQAGCDSIITIDLTINSINTNVLNFDPQLTADVFVADYQWLDCDNGFAPISGATNQSYTATANGNYAVEITLNGCTDTSACIAVMTVGVEEHDLTNLSVYPNPASDKVTIDLGTKYSSIEVTLINALGQELSTTKLKNASSIKLPIEGRRGVYFCRLTADGNSTTIRVIKE